MIETIQQLRAILVKKENEITQLRDRVVLIEKNHAAELSNIWLDLIQILDELPNAANVSDEAKLFSRDTIEQYLATQGIKRLPDGIRTSPFATKTVGTVKDESRAEDSIVRILKEGYMQNDILIRSGEVIRVKNNEE